MRRPVNLSNRGTRVVLVVQRCSVRDGRLPAEPLIFPQLTSVVVETQGVGWGATKAWEGSPVAPFCFDNW